MKFEFTENTLLALLFVVFTFVLFLIIIIRQLGGNEALFLIIGHTAAWAELVAIFYFRKMKPKDKPPAPPTETEPKP